MRGAGRGSITLHCNYAPFHPSLTVHGDASHKGVGRSTWNQLPPARRDTSEKIALPLAHFHLGNFSLDSRKVVTAIVPSSQCLVIQHALISKVLGNSYSVTACSCVVLLALLQQRPNVTARALFPLISFLLK